MKYKFFLIPFLSGLIFHSCSTPSTDLSDSQKQDIINAASQVVKQIFEASNNFEFESGLDFYANADDAWFVTDGKMKNLDDLRKEYQAVGPEVEVLENTILSWKSKVLSNEVVLFTLPIQLRLKFKGTPEYTGQLTWSAVLQKINDRWKVVQSHESWMNCAEVARALNPDTESE
jgi:ketosteroid isomerase-like protein